LIEKYNLIVQGFFVAVNTVWPDETAERVAEIGRSESTFAERFAKRHYREAA
jgi:hypothetical protein